MNAPQHVFPACLSVVDDSLHFGGLPLDRLAERVGQTPFYAYERAAIRARVAGLRAALPAGVSVHYAIKANPMPAVVDLLAGLVDGFDVASGGELKVALDSGMLPEQISFAGPGKSDAELASAVAAGVCVNLESEGEMERLAIAGERLGLCPRVAVRVNPDFALKHAGMRMGGGPTPFGVDAERVPAMLRRAGQLGLDVYGFHLFCGSQSLDAQAIASAQTSSVTLALQLAEAMPGPLRSVNIGGGVGVPYFPGELPPDVERIGASLAPLYDTLQRAAPSARLVLELGRYLVAEAGIYVCRVLERKASHGQTFLITNGGLHHHLAASGNFGQVIRKNYPVALATRMRGQPRERVSVTGPLCTPLDALARDLEMGRAEAGDLLVVFQSGAYGLTASPCAFLGHPAPAEVLV